MNEIDVTEAINILRNEKKLNEIKLAKAYDGYCLYPNPDDQMTWNECSAIDVAYNMAIQALENSQTEQKKGHWIPVDDPSITGRCSVCGFESHLCEDDVYGYDYCPNCGARLEVIDDE